MNKQDKQELRTNKQELISKYELIKNSYNFKVVATDDIISDLKRLDEPEKGYAEQSPQYLKNILARLRELPLHDREVWLKAIMSEFEQAFSRSKWREGYEQGKIESMIGCEKVKIPQFVANWIAGIKRNGLKYKNTFGFYEEITPSDNVYRVMYYIFKEGIAKENTKNWVGDNADAFARAWLDGYEIEKKKYVVTDGNHFYFKKYQEDAEIVILVDGQPCMMDYVKKFETREEAQGVADILGWKVEEVHHD